MPGDYSSAVIHYDRIDDAESAHRVRDLSNLLFGMGAGVVLRCAQLTPQLVTFNGASFDLPVLRYRAMVHGIAAPGLSSRPYFNRYTEDAIDLCDVLSSFSTQGKVGLHELCRAMGLPGKPSDISGEEVEKYYRDGHIREIAAYCESDVVNTYRVWLRYELFSWAAVRYQISRKRRMPQ